MIRRLILILFFTLGTLLAAMAQNSIDRQVERYSAIGQSRFTSLCAYSDLFRMDWLPEG
jgi:hypothetical protein